jgi:general L-amino acid transport system substrate-binding protein
MRKSAIAFLLLISFSVPFSGHAQTPPASTLAKVRAAGSLNCGIDTEEPEYTLADAHGNHAAFDIDLCKAVAIAVLGENAKFVIKPNRDEAGSLKALQAGETDLLATGSPYLEAHNGKFVFGRTVFFDYQGFLVNNSMGIHSLKDLAGKKICFLVGTEIEYEASAFMARQNIPFLPGPFSEEGEMEAAFLTRNCAAISADVSQLAYERIAFHGMARNFQILPDVAAKDPLAPVVRADDAQWAAIVDWVMQALIEAEEMGVSKQNVAEKKKSNDLEVRRLLGVQRGYGQFLGLDDEWAAHMIEAVGNYGEIFDRDLGMGSPMKLERGANRLWTQGGLMYAEPMR